MNGLNDLLARNKAWATKNISADPEYFYRMAKHQSPQYLWIGCSDSRVPSTQLVDLRPGEMFVHRNVANVVTHTDLNLLSVIQYAIEVLKVEQVIVCGHYGCGGVHAAVVKEELGLIDNWLQHVQDVVRKHGGSLDEISEIADRVRRVCELNVIEQVLNVCRTTIVQQAWAGGRCLAVHGLIYGLEDGLLRDLGISIQSPEEVTAGYDKAIRRVIGRDA